MLMLSTSLHRAVFDRFVEYEHNGKATKNIYSALISNRRRNGGSANRLNTKANVDIGFVLMVPLWYKQSIFMELIN